MPVGRGPHPDWGGVTGPVQGGSRGGCPPVLGGCPGGSRTVPGRLVSLAVSLASIGCIGLYSNLILRAPLSPPQLLDKIHRQSVVTGCRVYMC